MNRQPVQSVYEEILSHIKKQGWPYRGWYIDITSDWENRLFNEHQVPIINYWFIARQCYSNADARDVEQALLNLGCDGGRGGGDQSGVYVYAYLKGPNTNP